MLEYAFYCIIIQDQAALSIALREKLAAGC
jgi:hypothetical protein